jgi:hypothetical protein
MWNIDPQPRGCGDAVLVTGHEHKRAQKLYNHNPDIQDLCSVTNLSCGRALVSEATAPVPKQLSKKDRCAKPGLNG